jgi:hypothetical protein
MGLQKRDGDVPVVEGLAQELDELAEDFGLGLAEADALQQSLQQCMQCLEQVVPCTVLGAGTQYIAVYLE